MDEKDLNKERLELALEAAGLDLWENNLLTGEVTRKAMKTFGELGYNDQEVLHNLKHMLEFVHPDDLEMIQTAVHDHLAGRTPEYRCEFRLRSKAGTWIWYANYGRIMDANSTAPGQRFIGVTFNIDNRKRKEDEIAQINRKLAEQNTMLQSMNAALERLASSDALTGLANRRTLMELGAKECLRAARFSHSLSVLMVDLDSFKAVNDNWGHSVGDRVICAVADICRQRVREGVDVVARLGGEEFVVMLPEASLANAHLIAESLRQAVQEQRVDNEDGNPVPFTISIGVAALGAGGESFEQLLSHADKALYKAKQNGRNQVQIFAPLPHKPQLVPPAAANPG
ncbi:sensor domain-containing diguanylate cyclase [Rhodoferax saidenbachensis]|uniref:diguanylate cyclase n=1 Tax=Rhodoferax saidenbachensis TaxID=1484693 RepID=A0ABU1ZHR8_9BURK|nr:sensor domain-containing diguanylate cyclase [Rhodoferax saidenbachensis]MDR7305079.1 diguanylate cyclase (GGDEF)-like protein/PAS domain S-box-containing protein [Rhodoferax saidenbachensis]